MVYCHNRAGTGSGVTGYDLCDINCPSSSHLQPVVAVKIAAKKPPTTRYYQTMPHNARLVDQLSRWPLHNRMNTTSSKHLHHQLKLTPSEHVQCLCSDSTTPVATDYCHSCTSPLNPSASYFSNAAHFTTLHVPHNLRSWMLATAPLRYCHLACPDDVAATRSRYLRL